MELNPQIADEMGLEQGEYVRCISRRGDAVVMVMLTQRVAPNMVFIPFHYYDCVNRLSLGLLDPYSRQPAYKQAAIKIEKIDDQEAAAKLSMQRRNF
jgi:assimilatory nitrate reductase catalytic subunit